MPILEESWLPLANTLGFSTEEEMLRHFYQQMNFSLSEIAKVLGVAPWSVRRRLLNLRILLRARGGPNRVGKRRLQDVSDSELKHISPTALAKFYDVHIATVFGEKRLRKAALGEKKWNSVSLPTPEVLARMRQQADTTSSSPTSASEIPSILSFTKKELDLETL